MTDTLVLQASFLFFEAIFCFMVALYSFASNLSSEKKLRTTDLVTSLNALAGLLLLSDSMAYFFRGNPSALGYFMVRFSNGMVFLLSDVIMVGYTMYVTKQIFGHIGFGGKLPCSRRVRSCYTIGTIGILIVIINQFIGIYYSFDSNNIYHRGFLFPLALILPAVGVFLTGTIIIQYRKKMEIRRLISLLSYIVLMLIALIVQIFIYGYSFINISIGLGSIIVFMDTSISQKKEIERVAKVEIRTGLNNEYGCIQKINSLRDKSEIIGYTVIFFDLAKFSVINRKHGMKVGDQVLNNYSKELKKNVEKDEILGRQGSDYFIAVIKKRNLKKFLELIKEIPVEATSQITGKPLYFNISAVAGVYDITDAAITGEDAISNAYTALIYAKNVEKKKVVYMTESLKESIDRERRYGAKLQEALRNKEFKPVYQPKVNLLSNKLCGAEALVRWYKDEEIILPGDFIPLMEKNDLVRELDFFMLENVCNDLDKWLSEGLTPPRISINFSKRNLANPNLAKDIDKIVTEKNIPKDLIEIEVTETLDEFPTQTLKRFVDELHDLGYTVAIDDFGCGSASVSLLRDVSFDTLKIDKSFVDRSEDKEVQILSHIISMAKAIDLDIVAEGVEQKEQIKTLEAMGVERIQGFYYDKPLSQEEMRSRIVSKVYDV